MLSALTFVFLGGGFGAVSRFLTSLFVNQFTTKTWIAIFLVNFIGSAIFFFTLKHFPESKMIHHGVRIGFLGALTTFSSFSYESYKLLIQGSYAEFAGSIALNVFFGIIIGIFILNQKVMY